MLKRGQVGTFVAIALVVLALFVMVFYFRSEIISGFETTQEVVDSMLNVKMQAFSQHVKECLAKEGKNAIFLVGDQGGILHPVNTKSYQGLDWMVLCSKVDEDPCVRNIVTEGDFESAVGDYMSDSLTGCIDSSKFGEDITVGSKELEVTLGTQNVRFDLFYPVEFKKDTVVKKQEQFTYIVDVEVARVLFIVNDVLDAEAQGLRFDTSGYIPVINEHHHVEYDFFMNDKYYKVWDEDSGFMFKFVTEGDKIYE